MKTTILLLLIFIVNSAFASNNYIGNIVPPYPPSHKDNGGYLVGLNKSNKTTKYSVSLTEKDNSQYFWLTKEIGRKNNNKNAIWQAIDLLILKKPKKGYFYALGICKVNQEIDDRIIALVKYDPNIEWFKSSQKAWKVNIKKEKIEPFSSKGISCANEGWGL